MSRRIHYQLHDSDPLLGKVNSSQSSSSFVTFWDTPSHALLRASYWLVRRQENTDEWLLEHTEEDGATLSITTSVPEIIRVLLPITGGDVQCDTLDAMCPKCIASFPTTRYQLVDEGGSWIDVSQLFENLYYTVIVTESPLTYHERALSPILGYFSYIDSPLFNYVPGNPSPIPLACYHDDNVIEPHITCSEEDDDDYELPRFDDAYFESIVPRHAPCTL